MASCWSCRSSNDQLGFFTARSVSALLLLIALLVLATSVLRNRRAVAALDAGRGGWRRARGLSARPDTRSGTCRCCSTLLVLFIIVVTRPGDVLLPMLWATARVLIAGAVGWMIAGLLGRAIARGIRLPGWVNTRLPLLERRLNTFVPRALLVLRVVVLIAVICYAFDTLGLVGVGNWLNSTAGVWFTTRAVSVVLIVLLSFAGVAGPEQLGRLPAEPRMGFNPHRARGHAAHAASQCGDGGADRHHADVRPQRGGHRHRAADRLGRRDRPGHRLRRAEDWFRTSSPASSSSSRTP